MIKGRDWRRRRRDRKNIKVEQKENEFYTNRGRNQNKPKVLSIDEIKDNIDKAETKVSTLKNKQFSMMADGATDAEVSKANRDVKVAEREVAGLNNLMTEAFGLGPNGYWENNTKPRKVDRINAWVNNPEGYRPPEAMRPKVTRPVTRNSTDGIPSSMKTGVIRNSTDGIPSSMKTGVIRNSTDGIPSSMKTGVIRNSTDAIPSSMKTGVIRKTTDAIPSSMKTGVIRKTTDAIPSSMKTGVIRNSTDAVPSSMKTGVIRNSTDAIPSSMKTGISSNATDGHKYATIDNDERQQGREGESRYDKETQELCANIEQYLLAKADPNMSSEEFLGKYPYGTQQMQMWTNQLKVKMGEDAARMFMSRSMKKAETQFGGPGEETVGMNDPIGDQKNVGLDEQQQGDVVTDSKNWIEGAVDDAGNWVSGAVDDAGNWVSGAVDDAGNWVSGAVDDAGNWVSGAVDDAGNWVSGAVDDAGNWVSGAVDDAGNWVSGAVDDAGNWVSGAVDDAGNWVSGAVDDAGNWVSGAVDDAGNWVSGAVDDAGNWVSGAVDDAGNWVSGAVDDAGNWVSGAVGDAGNWVSGAVDDAGNWVSGAVDDAGNWVSGAVGDAGNWVSGAVDDAGNWVEGAVDDAGDWVKENLEPIFNNDGVTQDNGESVEQNTNNISEEERQRLLQTPLVNMSFEEYKDFKDVKLVDYDYELEQRKQSDYDSLLEAQKLKYIDAYNNLHPISKQGLEFHGITSAEEYIEFRLENDNWHEKTLKKLDKDYESNYIKKEDFLTNTYDLTQDLISLKEEGTHFEFTNITGLEIDPDIMDNIVIVGLDESANGEHYLAKNDLGSLSIQVNSFKEVSLTQEEAWELYLQENEEAKELIKLMANMIDMKSIPQVIACIADALIDLDANESTALTMIDESLKNLGLPNINAIREGVNASIKGFLKDYAIETLYDITEGIHYDIEDVRGGNYIEIEVLYDPREAGPQGLGAEYQVIRLYEYNGMYVYDPLNKLTHVVCEGK